MHNSVTVFTEFLCGGTYASNRDQSSKLGYKTLLLKINDWLKAI